MPRCILHHNGKFIEWSTIVDAPVSDTFSYDEMTAHLTRFDSLENVQERLSRAIKNGSSWIEPTSFDEVIEGNRAGDNESKLSRKELISKYFSD